jgi:7-cyano-7-deazaguanine tRNA-ribosyltransferase
MDFYVSWSHSDPLYQLYDERCSMLISPTAVSSIWQLNRFPRLPHQIMLDSGSYSYITNRLPLPSPKEAFNRQIAVLGNSDIPSIICAVDKPMLGKSLSLTQRNQAIDKTIANAWELKVLMAEYYIRSSTGKQTYKRIEPLAIIQGYDIPTLRYCARQLVAIGYSRFGIGSIAHLYHSEEIVRRVEAVQSIVGASVHVFGVSAIETMKRLKELGVTSVDSARPIKAAIYNEVLYSEPYMRFGIEGSHFAPGNSKFSPGKLISEPPIVCPCPVCKNSLNRDILKLGTREHLLLRAVHNYYHIKRMIAD